MSNIQFHLSIQPRQSENWKLLTIQSFFSKKASFSYKIVSPTITCQILAAFKIYVVSVFSENIYKLDLSFI